MAVGSTPASLVNRALQEIGSQTSISGIPPTFDNTAYGNAAGILYPPAITLLLRQADYEFSRAEVALIPVSPIPYPWPFAYLYPVDCAKIRQVMPPQWIQFDPQPIRWDEMVQAGSRIIACNAGNANLIYSTLNVIESQFDTVFEETLVRYLASAFSMSNAGRPDFSVKLLEQAGGLMQQSVGLDS